MRRFRQATREQIVLRPQIRLFDPCRYGRPGRFGQFELHRSLGLSLHDHRPGQYLVAVCHVPNVQIHQIASTQLAVDRQVEHGQVTNAMFVLEVDSDGPDVLGFEWWLLADQLAFVPRLTRLIGFHVRLLRG
ncbi:hypothetical protein ABW22_09285 [Thiobacillus denitrificans]|uniref:Uncharacterized protein n=1 Tax=Thiobacillus denitrificans TaxID=36861 RepID=A0A119CVZ5_THIDE|nr:hypothetical protein ABW22_09285 [Thiobacillus denitrificans]